ncbi:50S ribosomal protein L15 [Candidatus Bathyarchaeota archaeon]|jgi:large subunit ribosomal protein L15|nr:50S ribosomal protein L15 [Candidatus Bathyarchaeota archaeon]
MATRKRKVRKQRGSRFYGWGTSGQHRAGGMLGGHGKAGRFRHKKSAVIRYGIELGRKRLLPRLGRKERIVASVGQLEDMLVHPKYAHAVSEHEGKKLLDLRSLGYMKLLGSGKIQVPVVVRIDEFSKSAASKIEAAGGRIEKTTA